MRKMKKNKLLLMSFVFWLTSVISLLSNVTFAGLNWDNLSHLVYNEDNWLITVYSEDFSYWVTLQDKDLWANSVWETWNYYQYWNNNPWNSLDDEIKNQWSSYIFNDYYQNWGWQIDNIESDEIVKWYDTVNHVATDVKDRQWPCASWYHVPSAWEWNELLKLWCAQDNGCNLSVYDNIGWPTQMDWASYIDDSNIWVSSRFIDAMNFVAWGFMYNYTKSTYGGSSWNAWDVWDDGKFWNYWASSIFPMSNSEGWADYAWRTNLAFWDIWVWQDGALWMVSPAWYTAWNWWELIRCFKDSYINNLVLNYDNNGVQIVEMLPFESGESPDMLEITNAIDKIGRAINLAEWEHIAWYVLGEDNEKIPFDLNSENISWTLYLFWEKEINNYTVKFLDIDSSELLPAQVFEYNEEKALTMFYGFKNGYKFEWWRDNHGNLYENWMVVKNLSVDNWVEIILTAQWEKVWWNYSWWWGRRSNWNVVLIDDGQENKLVEEEMWDENTEIVDDVLLDDEKDIVGDWKLSQESFIAYKWAYKNWLTQYDNIDDARMKDFLNRAEMAKLVSNFALNVLSKMSDEDKQKICSEYSDLWNVDENMKYFIVSSCKLNYMWYQSNWIDLLDKFRPDNYLTLAEASVIISRMLWWNTYSLWEELWYVWHLRAVYENALLDDITSPDRDITREEAFIMLYRLYSMAK